MQLIMGESEEEIDKRDYDLIIIGAGAAGLSAAIYAVRSGLQTLVLDANKAGGLTAEAPLVENWLGIPAIPGTELANNFVEHAKQYAKIIEFCRVKSIKNENGIFHLDTEKGEFKSKALLFSTGTQHKHLNIPGEHEYYGKGLSYCVTCDGYLFKNKKVAVIGGGNSGAIAAIYLKGLAKEVKIFEFMPRYMCEDAYVKQIKEMNIEYKMNVQVMEILGDGKSVTGLKYKDRSSGEVSEEKFDGVFIYVGLLPQTDLAKNLGVKLDAKGYIVTDPNGRTSVPRIYAAGDCTGAFAQIVVAAGDGAKAANAAYQDLTLK
jgi:thioredoxin reductase (NADPH)